MATPLFLGPGGSCALLIIRDRKNTLGPRYPCKALHKPSGAVDNEKTDGVTGTGVTHWRGRITMQRHFPPSKLAGQIKENGVLLLAVGSRGGGFGDMSPAAASCPACLGEPRLMRCTEHY